MKLHLRMLLKSIQLVTIGILVFGLLIVGLLGISTFAQWRVDVNVAREERMEIRNRSVTDD